MTADGMHTLVLAMGITSGLMLALPARFCAQLGGRLWKLRGAGACGAGAALLWALHGCFEGISPPPQLTIHVPSGFAHDTVIFITDPTASQEVRWSRAGRVFAVQRGHIAVPQSGVVRVRTLGLIDAATPEATLSDGRAAWSRWEFSIDGVRAASFSFTRSGASREPEPALLHSRAWLDYVHAREAER
jgi:hypothetical protein